MNKEGLSARMFSVIQRPEYQRKRGGKGGRELLRYAQRIIYCLMVRFFDLSGSKTSPRNFRGICISER